METMRLSQLRQQASIQNILRSTGAQAKLHIGQPDDKYEQEADRVADQVMAMPDPKLQRQPENEEEEETVQTKPLADQITPLIQRQSEPEGEEVQPGYDQEPEDLTPILESVPTGDADELAEEEEEFIQPKSDTDTVPQITPGITHALHSMKGAGQPLPKSERAFFESRFGTDFSNVRMHNDTRAARTAQSVNARAFTLGRDIVFGAGQYSPASLSGRSLLAHELTHVIQQGGGRTRSKAQHRESIESDPIDVARRGLGQGEAISQRPEDLEISRKKPLNFLSTVSSRTYLRAESPRVQRSAYSDAVKRSRSSGSRSLKRLRKAINKAASKSPSNLFMATNKKTNLKKWKKERSDFRRHTNAIAKALRSANVHIKKGKYSKARDLIRKILDKKFDIGGRYKYIVHYVPVRKTRPAIRTFLTRKNAKRFLDRFKKHRNKMVRSLNKGYSKIVRQRVAGIKFTGSGLLSYMNGVGQAVKALNSTMRQLHFADEVQHVGIAVSFPPTKKQLQQYFSKFAGTAGRPGKAVKAFSRYIKSFYLHLGHYKGTLGSGTKFLLVSQQTNVPPRRFTSMQRVNSYRRSPAGRRRGPFTVIRNIEYSTKTVYWYAGRVYSSKPAARRAAGRKGVITPIGVPSGPKWRGVTRRRSIGGFRTEHAGKRLIDCEGYEYLAKELLGVKGAGLEVQHVSVGTPRRNDPGHVMIILRQRVGHRLLGVVSNEKILTRLNVSRAKNMRGNQLLLTLLHAGTAGMYPNIAANRMLLGMSRRAVYYIGSTQQEAEARRSMRYRPFP